MSAASSASRRLVLSVDVNGCIFPADPAGRMTLSQSLNAFLAGQMWALTGTNHSAPVFNPINPTEPLSNPPPPPPPPLDEAEVPNGGPDDEESSAQVDSYYKWCEVALGDQFESRADFKAHVGSFTERPPGDAYRPIFETMLDASAWKHDDVVDGLTFEDPGDGQAHHILLPSFLMLLVWLDAQNRDYSVLIRTFGSDIPTIRKVFQELEAGRHPGFPSMGGGGWAVDDTRVGSVQRSGDAADGSAKIDVSLGDFESSSEAAIYEHLSRNCPKIAMIQEDYAYWAGCGYLASAGKPLWIDPADTDVHHIFFDDNARDWTEHSIIDVRTPVPGSTAFASVDPAGFFGSHVVRADLTSSLVDEDHFINCVRACEAAVAAAEAATSA